MNHILEIRNLTKRFDGFQLENLELSLPKGSIMGLIGENGAGKSTTIKLILNLIRRDAGEIRMFGKDNIKHEREIKEEIGVVFDECNFPDSMRVSDISRFMKEIYKKWDDQRFRRYIDAFALPSQKPVKEFSRGMKMKLSIAVALSHKARFLILDEATSGLDPIIRDEILDILLEFIQDEENAVFVSSHILSDIEKAADYITLMHHGKILFSESKDQLLDSYGVLRCGNAEFNALDPSLVMGYRKNDFGVEALVKRDMKRSSKRVDHATIEDIMLYMIRGNRQ